MFVVVGRWMGEKGGRGTGCGTRLSFPSPSSFPPPKMFWRAGASGRFGSVGLAASACEKRGIGGLNHGLLWAKECASCLHHQHAEQRC